MDGLTLIARCDSGGLGAQTSALFEFLKPETTVVVHSSPPRGIERPERFVNGWGGEVLHVSEKAVTAAFLRHAVANGGVLLSCETFYTDVSELAGWCKRVLVANPELFDSRYAGWSDVVVVPTSWELSRMPEGVRVLPHPQRVASANSIRVRQRPVRTFFHVAAPAMLDRCGYRTVLQACALMQEECTVLVHGGGREHPSEARWPEGRAKVVWSDVDFAEWSDIYPVEADMLVLPRRYGGLSLPTQEAAACGMPNLMPDLAPQNGWPGLRFGIRSGALGGSVPTQMKGGTFDVYYPSPKDLAAKMDELVRGEHDIEQMSLNALRWARMLRWDELESEWLEVLG